MKTFEIFEKDGKEIRIDIYEGYANWYAADANGDLFPDPEDVIAEGRDSRAVWNELKRLGYKWLRTMKLKY